MYLLMSSVTADAANVLQSIQQNGKIKIGYRTDAPPFSFKNEIGEPAGYTVNLCRAVAAIIGKRLKRSISITYVPVTAKNRFEAVRKGRVDLLCGATTETLSRRELVQFSVATFVTGASVIYRADGPSSFRALVGRKIGVVSGTTTEKDLASTLKQLKITAQVVQYRNHDDGLQALKSGQADAYFGDRAILSGLLRKSPNSLIGLKLSEHFFSMEPYALAMPLGSNRFRNEVDWALSKIYKSGGLMKIFRNSFGNAEPSNFMKALVVINALSD
jgi:polar amino acid transport system substrate-binding protein/glutamate/aspartate transport system substrate-binding protein